MTDENAKAGTGGTDWPARVTAAVESFVTLVRDHSLRPALTAIRFAVLGVMVAGLGLLAAVLGVVGIVRLLTVDAFGGRVWGADLLVGGLLSAGGLALLLWSSRVGEHDAA